jgi:hypothetical protein
MTTTSAATKDHTALPLLAFVVCFLILSHAAASSYAGLDDGLSLSLMIPLSGDILPLSLASSFLSSIFPSEEVDAPPLPTLSPDCPPHPSDVRLRPHLCSTNVTSPVPSTPLLSDEHSFLLSSSLCFFVFLSLLLVLLHDRHHPYMLRGRRPALPLPLDLSPPLPRLGHRVGSKRGRKLSAVEEEDGSSEEDLGELLDPLEEESERAHDLLLRQELLTMQRMHPPVE